jgi:hypothetical protein
MAKATPFQAEVQQALAMLDEALTGGDAADALLEKHARPEAAVNAVNFPQQERVLAEAVALMERWVVRTGSLLNDLDAATENAHLRFQRLFDERAGEEARSFLHRKLAFHADPATIVTDLKDLLSASALLDGTLKGLRPLAQRRHRQGEAHLLRIIERRRRLDFEIEQAQHRVDVLNPKISDRQMRLSSPPGVVSQAAFAQEIKALVDERQACLARESMLRPERATLQQLISLHEDFVDALNGHIGIFNVMRNKLVIDIEQRIALMKAVSADTGLPVGDLPQSVVVLVEAYEASALSGYALADRKARADEAFARRMKPEAPASVEAGAASDVAQEVSGSPS